MVIRKSPASLVAFLQGKARGEIVLSLFVLTTAVYLVMILGTIPHVQGFAPEVALFDLSPTGYSHEHAKLLLGSLGAEGRSVYLFPQLAMDFIYPGLFAISYSLTLIWVFAKRCNPDAWIFNLSLLPVLAGFFDYAENLLIIQMIRDYPDVAEFLVSAASFCTVLKSLFTTLALLLLIGGFAFLVVCRPPIKAT
ncbi:MAG: hypothetical protein SynsKO_29710 [Synoicihabitans sp.]